MVIMVNHRATDDGRGETAATRLHPRARALKLQLATS